MQNDSSNGTAPLGRMLDYKTLSVAACALIVILGGGLIGLWNQGVEQSLRTLSDADTKQLERVNELQNRISTNTARLQQLEKYTEDQEQRIRIIEHSPVFNRKL